MSDAQMNPARTLTLVPIEARNDGRAENVVQPRARRLLRWELLIVLAIFPLPATISALVSMTNHIVQGGAQASHASDLIPDSVSLSVLFGLLIELSSVAAAALVWYLLVRSGEGTSSIGLDKRHPRQDAAYVLPVFLLVFVASFLVGGLLETALHLKSFPVDDPVHGLAYLPVLLVSGLVAGIVEETVVLGYLVRRLEQLGFGTFPIVVIGVAVRASYHVYYGPGVIPIILWATASIIFYRKIRRLAPFIIVHSLWDMSLFLGQAVGGWVIGIEFIVLMPLSIVFCALWWPRKQRPIPGWPPLPPPSGAGGWLPPGGPGPSPQPVGAMQYSAAGPYSSAGPYPTGGPYPTAGPYTTAGSYAGWGQYPAVPAAYPRGGSYPVGTVPYPSNGPYASGWPYPSSGPYPSGAPYPYPSSTGPPPPEGPPTQSTSRRTRDRIPGEDHSRSEPAVLPKH